MTPYAFFAFISLLLFFLCIYGVYAMTRVLTGSEQYGSRIIIVDAQGNGDQTTIQAAIDAAYAQTPAADSRC